MKHPRHIRKKGGERERKRYDTEYWEFRWWKKRMLFHENIHYITIYQLCSLLVCSSSCSLAYEWCFIQWKSKEESWRWCWTTSTSQFNPPTYKWLVSFLIVQPNYLTLFPSYSSNDVFNASAVGFCNNFFFRLLSKNCFPFLCLHIHQRSIICLEPLGFKHSFPSPFWREFQWRKG